jgi:phosphohistidine phosphatase
MRILLMRHGEAVDTGARSDGERWLTPHGRRVTRGVAQWLAANGAPVTLRTSPLVRAVQTAEIVMGACGLEQADVMRELALGDVDAVVRAAQGFDAHGPLCLVGHEPTLSEAVARLLALPSAPRFSKSAVFALDRGDDGAFTLAWRLRPRALQAVTELA